MERAEPSPPSPAAWQELLALSQDEANDRLLLERLLELWRTAHGAAAVALYRDRVGLLEQEALAGGTAELPPLLDVAALPGDLGSLRLAGGRLFYAPADLPLPAPGDPLTLLIAAALMHNPDLVLLDEPFSGLDIGSALILRSLIQELAARGKVVLFSSHELDTVERISHRVVILHRGKLVAAMTSKKPFFDIGTPDGLEHFRAFYLATPESGNNDACEHLCSSTATA